MLEKELLVKKENFVFLEKKKKISQEYIMGKTLGAGGNGIVRLVEQKSSGQVRTVKILRKTEYNNFEILEEIDVLSKLDHPNIMRIYEVFEDKINYYIVAEYCKGGDLFENIVKRGNYSEKDAASIMSQILSGIFYSHKNNYLHGDIKAENILLDENPEKENSFSIKIIDWGTAKKFKENKKETSIEGTPFYMAPEVINGSYDQKCDIWSCGVLLYILLSGHQPFNGENQEKVFQSILKDETKFSEKEWGNISDEAKDLVKKMLVKDPRQRLSAQECLEHAWIKNNLKNEKIDNKILEDVINNLKNFKKERKLEQATIGYIVNQVLSMEERKDLKKVFQEWDKNGDGVLSREEILEACRKINPKVDENEVDNMIKSVDLDGNGVIDYSEFIICSINKEKITKEKNLELCFKAFDYNNSGKISVKELLRVFKKSDKKVKFSGILENMIKETDVNKDGEISYDEFKSYMLKYFI